MKKTILYRLFGFGSIPKKLRPVLEEEGIVIADEGMGGWFIARNVKGPGKRYRHRAAGFSGCLAVTKRRIVCFANGRRQIHISVEDRRLSELYVNVPSEETLSISFESSAFRTGWEGVIEFRFNTGKALEFQAALASLGVHQGAAPR